MPIDLGNVLAEGGIAVIGFVASQLRSEAVHGRDIKELQRDRDEHAETLREYRKKFEDMPNSYVPRHELSEKLNSIKESQDEVKKKVERLIELLISYGKRQASTGMPPEA